MSSSLAVSSELGTKNYLVSFQIRSGYNKWGTIAYIKHPLGKVLICLTHPCIFLLQKWTFSLFIPYQYNKCFGQCPVKEQCILAYAFQTLPVCTFQCVHCSLWFKLLWNKQNIPLISKMLLDKWKSSWLFWGRVRYWIRSIKALTGKESLTGMPPQLPSRSVCISTS